MHMDADDLVLRCPFPHRVNPHVDRARTHVTRWVRRVGLVQRAYPRKRFERADFAWFAAVVHPTADASQLNLMADWFAWLFLVDDQLDDGRLGRSPGRAAEITRQMRSVLESDSRHLGVGPDVPTAVSSLADLWQRTAPHATPEWRQRFVAHLAECLRTAAVWEAGNRVGRIIPSEETYIVNRRHTGAIYVCMDLIEVVERISVPESLYRSTLFTSALDAACNVVCWTNDVYSLAKERARGEVHNLVFLVQHHRGLDQQTALARVRAAIEYETERFLKAEAELLAAHPDQARLFVPCLNGMRTWMRGNLDWSRRTQRYHPLSGSVEERPEEYLEARLMEAER